MLPAGNAARAVLGVLLLKNGWGQDFLPRRLEETLSSSLVNAHKLKSKVTCWRVVLACNWHEKCIETSLPNARLHMQ